MNRKEVRARLEASLKAKLKAHADDLGVPMNDVVEAAIHDYLNPDDYKTVSLEYLASIDRKHQVVLKRLDMLLETVGKFILVWFMNTPDPDDLSLKKAMARKGRERYQKFLDLVSASLGDSKSVRRAFEERLMKPEDFDGQGGRR